MLPDLDTVVPHFQPIINSLDQNVFAYEVLARQKRDGAIRSLGPFFEDPDTSDDEKFILDLHVRELALAEYSRSGSDAKLFVNMKPSWVYKSRENPEAFSPLLFCEKYSVDPKNIVVEVTEESLLGDQYGFTKALSAYRKEGCLLAIDDYGKGDSSIERIAYVAPDIIKLDHAIVSKMDTQSSFFELCENLRAAGMIHGFTLLFEGVETIAQLERCLKSGWCYLQGWLFSPARAGLTTDYEQKDLLADILSLHTFEKKWEMKQHNAVLQKMEAVTEEGRPLIPLEEDALRKPGALHAFMTTLPYYCLQYVVCDQNCRKISPLSRIVTQDAAVELDDNLGTIPSQRVFLQGLQAIGEGREKYLSGVHRNVLTKEPVITYMHKLREDRYLCVDIMSNAF